jgi:hypothetical protein
MTLEDQLPIVIYTGHSVLSPATLQRGVPSDMKIKGTSVYSSLSVTITFNSTLLSSCMSTYLCLPPPVRSVNFSIEVFRWRITVKVMLRGVNKMLGVG